MNNINLRFEVPLDTPSEVQANARRLVIEGLELLKANLVDRTRSGLTVEDRRAALNKLAATDTFKLINALLNDGT